MKYLICQNSEGAGKYFRGRVCREKVVVDNAAEKVLCWKCLALLMPMPDEKKPTGYPRGWKFMAEFVDKEGNVYHKGEIQKDLFGTREPTEIKEAVKEKKKKTKVTLDDKIISEFNKRSVKKKKSKK